MSFDRNWTDLNGGGGGESFGEADHAHIIGVLL